MVSHYRRPALTTDRKWPESIFRLLGALLASLALSPPANATGPSPTLRPYSAQYQTTARGFDLSITRKLEADSNNHFILTNAGKILVVGFHEISVFRVAGTQVRSISYIYQGTGLVNSRRELHFSPESDEITCLYKDQWYQLPYTEDTLDRMNQVEQVRLILLKERQSARDIALRVADGKRVKESHLVLIGEETLETALGPVATVHYERLHDDPSRKSDLWFAPQWDYLMIRTVHIEDGNPVEMLLTSATIDGIPVAGH